MTQSGGAGDGVTDDTALIQAFLNSVPVGAEVTIPAGKQWLIDSADLRLPPGITLQGQGGLEGGSRIGGPALILNPNYRIYVGSGNRLSNFKILRKGLIDAPTTGQSDAAVDAWMAEAFLRQTSGSTSSGATLPFANTAGITVGMRACGNEIGVDATVIAVVPNTSVTFSGMGGVSYPVAAGSYVRFGNSVALDIQALTGFGGATLDRLEIIGFNTGIMSECGRIYADMLQIDCITAWYATRGGDASYINRIHCVPFYGGTWTRRSGPGFLMTRADGWHFTSCTTAGWANGFVLFGVGGVTMSRCWMETSDDGVTTTCGFKVEGHVQNEVSLINCIGGGSVHFDMQGTGGFVNLVSPITAAGAVSATTIAHYRLGPGSSGQIITPELVTGLVTPFLVQSGVGRWRIISPQMNTAPNPWISGAAGDLAKISIQSAWSNDLTVDQQVQTHLTEKVWISRNTSLASIDGSPTAALAVETLAGGTGDTNIQSFWRNGTRIGYIGTSNNNTALLLTGDGTRDLSFQGNTKLEFLSPTTHAGGAAFGSVIASSSTDLTAHLALYGNTYGVSITNSRMNLVTANALMFVSAGVDQAWFQAGSLTFLNATANFINFGANGTGAPTFTTRSAGTKVVLYPAIAGATSDIAIGTAANTLWMGVRDASDVFRWYAGTTNIATLGAGSLTFLNPTSNLINFSAFGIAAPSFTTRSVGTKIVFYPNIDASHADIAMGLDTNTLWMGVRDTTDLFRWYGGTTLAATLTGAGALTLVGGLAVAGTVSGVGVAALLAPYAPLASPTFTGVPAAPTAAPGTSTTQLASTAFVQAAITGGTAGVASFNTRTGAVTLAAGDVTGLGAYAGAFTTLSASGAVSGAGFSTYFASPPAIGGTAPAAGAFTTVSATGQITSTLASGTAPLVVASTTNVANLNASSLGGATFAAPGAIGGGTPDAGSFTTLSASSTVSGSGFTTLLSPYAPLASPTLTGTPAAPTASVSTNTTQIATTAFVLANRRNSGKLQAQWVNGAIVTDDTVWMSYDAPYAGTINTLKHVTGTGSFTVAIKINGTNVTSLSAVSVSSTPATATATAANTFAAGDVITAVISAATGSPTGAMLSVDLTWS